MKNIKEVFANYFTGDINNSEEMRKLVNSVEAFFNIDGIQYACARFEDHFIHEKKNCRTSFYIFDLSRELNDFFEGFVLTVDSTVNNSNKDRVKFYDFKNLQVRDAVTNDSFYLLLATQYFNKYPRCNHMLNMRANVKDMEGNLVGVIN